MEAVVRYRQLINPSRLARPESVTAVWTFQFHRRHRGESGLAPQRDASVIRRTKLAVLLMGALVIWVGSSENGAAGSKSRRPRQSVSTSRRALRAATHPSSGQSHARHRARATRP